MSRFDEYRAALSDAAEVGDWDRYYRLEAEMASEAAATATAGILAPYADAIQESVRSANRQKAEEEIPGITELRKSPAWQQEMQRRPKLAQWIEIVEANPTTADDYLEVLRMGVNGLVARGQVTVQRKSEGGAQTPAPAPRTIATAPTPADALRTSESRQQFIQSIEKRYGDFDLDSADPENPRFKAERGE